VNPLKAVGFLFGGKSKPRAAAASLAKPNPYPSWTVQNTAAVTPKEHVKQPKVVKPIAVAKSDPLAALSSLFRSKPKDTLAPKVKGTAVKPQAKAKISHARPQSHLDKERA
jgi:hypothetical protein